MTKIFKILIAIICSTLIGFSQSVTGASIDNPPPTEPEVSTTPIIPPMTQLEFYLSLIILIFGLIIICLEIFLIKNRKISSEDAIKFIIITLIIVSTLFLITAGYSNDQIAPAVGLLGTIAGYLLGRIQNGNNNEENNEKTT